MESQNSSGHSKLDPRIATLPVSYMVITPEYEVYSTGEYEPPEFGADFIELITDSKTSAKKLAVKMWLEGTPHDKYTRTNYCLKQRSYGDNPYTGIIVKKFPDDFDDIVFEEDEENEEDTN